MGTVVPWPNSKWTLGKNFVCLQYIACRSHCISLRVAALSVVASIGVGCRTSEVEPKVVRKKYEQKDVELLYAQADLVNKLVEKHAPELFHLPDNQYKSRIRSEAFNFLLNREASEFPDFFEVAYGPFTDDLIPESVIHAFWERDASAQHYYVWTNFWKRFPSMLCEDTPCMDEYVVSVVDGRVVRIKGRATLPY